ncbi:MAG: DUF2235 domain-containing protein [Cyanobacteria bacterium P01_A01_bin.15]
MALYAFDGTGDSWDQTSAITPTAKTNNDRYLTNVVFFYKEYVDSGLQGEYFSGVGSAERITNRIVGGAFGLGAMGVVKRAFDRLQANYKNGDQVIDIVGYSRGAALARAFADKTFRDYKKLIDPKGNFLTTPPKIRFIGLFDTVASFGNPLNDNELLFQERVPKTAQNTFHAMSLDVRKIGFGLDRTYGENVLEVWFRGGHGDVGGNATLSNGLPNRGRTNIALTFMLKKAQAAGVELNATDYPMDIKAPVVVDGNSDRLSEDRSRQYRSHDIFHYSLFDAAGQVIDFPGCVPLPAREKLVIEELSNESELSEQRLLQLTPELSAKYPDTRSIYNKLYE